MEHGLKDLTQVKVESQKENGKTRSEAIFEEILAENLPKLTLNHNSKCATNSKHEKEKEN